MNIEFCDAPPALLKYFPFLPDHPALPGWSNVWLLALRPLRIEASPQPSVPGHSLEYKLERELDRARAADLIERAETAIRATGSQTTRQRLS